MIDQIRIQNFKSIVDLTLELGRVNLFIGENGCGKSNILEAIGFASESTISNFLPDTLQKKGVRVSDLDLFCSSFTSNINNIEVAFIGSNYTFKTDYEREKYDMINVSEDGWIDSTREKLSGILADFLISNIRYIVDRKTSTKFEDWFVKGIDFNENTPEEVFKRFEQLRAYCVFVYGDELKRYMIYAPENSALRKFEEEGQMKPLGYKGEGLFSLIKSLANDNGTLQHIKEHLEMIDWFEDFSIPGDLMSNEYRIAIKDKYINSELSYFDQRSANEGFLFLLFYITLFSTKRTPQFFAIDNIEASFNPKLCAKLISTLVKLAKENDKQTLMTTHNPATLDGLDLNDPEQRLFVVRRNADGHTIATRIEKKPELSAPMKLSEMWTKGLLGGLPENF